jgi:hypothetical protein
MAFYERVPWPAVGVLMVMPYDPGLHAAGSKATEGKCLWSDHEADASWSVVWRGERWAVCDADLAAMARAELGAADPPAPTVPARDLNTRFQDHVIGELAELRGRYNPTVFLGMVQKLGAVAAAKRLLADSRHTSYGFERLWEMQELQKSVEFAVCLPWFRELFTEAEMAEAEQRLRLHDFPLQERLAAVSSEPPVWTGE